MFTIDDVRQKCRARKIKWSLHSAERMLERGIGENDVIACLMNGEVIEEYPDFWLNPAALILGISLNGRHLHVVVGMDEYIHIVTAYYPDENKFAPDFKTRKGN